MASSVFGVAAGLRGVQGSTSDVGYLRLQVRPDVRDPFSFSSPGSMGIFGDFLWTVRYGSAIV